MSDLLEKSPPAWVCEGFDDLPGVRWSVFAATLATEVAADAVDDFVVAVSEVASNAVTHGRAPFRISLWTAPHNLLCTVSDAGAGIVDEHVPGQQSVPAGVRPDYGHGLWAVHELCDSVTYQRSEQEFTVRLSLQG